MSAPTHSLTHIPCPSIRPSVRSFVHSQSHKVNQPTHCQPTMLTANSHSLTHCQSSVTQPLTHSAETEREGREEGWILPFTPTPTHSLTHPLTARPNTTHVFLFVGMCQSPFAWAYCGVSLIGTSMFTDFLDFLCVAPLNHIRSFIFLDPSTETCKLRTSTSNSQPYSTCAWVLKVLWHVLRYNEMLYRRMYVYVCGRQAQFTVSTVCEWRAELDQAGVSRRLRRSRPHGGRGIQLIHSFARSDPFIVRSSFVGDFVTSLSVVRSFFRFAFKFEVRCVRCVRCVRRSVGWLIVSVVFGCCWLLWLFGSVVVTWWFQDPVVRGVFARLLWVVVVRFGSVVVTSFRGSKIRWFVVWLWLAGFGCCGCSVRSWFCRSTIRWFAV